jgi:hypothetical protein
MKRTLRSAILICIALLAGWDQNVVAQTTTFSFTGAVQNYTVPAGCIGVQLDVVAGKGGGSNYSNGGAAGRVQVTMNVTPGQVYGFYVGSTGAGVGNNTGLLGMNGSGHVGGNGTSFGGAGGGSSEIWLAGSPIIVAGAGGGGSWQCTSDHGGLGGTTIGSNGLKCAAYTSVYCGTGGNTLTATGGICASSGFGATNGSFGSGGNANTSGTPFWASGGGAGYYGGGGGSLSGSGGGGSSYPISTGGAILGLIHTQGYNNTGNGYILVTQLPPVVTASPSSLSFAPVAIGGTSVPPIFTVLSGAFMGAGPLTITLPAGSPFAVSTDGITWGNTTTLAYTPPTFTATDGRNVYVRFSPTAVTSYSSTMSITGGGLATAVTVSLSGSGVNVCTGTPSGAVSIATPSTGSIYTPFTLTLAPAPSTGGFTYQWQSSPTGSAPWANISGAVLSTYSFMGISANTYYRSIITCSGSGLSTASSPVQITAAGLAASSCVPTAGQLISFGFQVATTGYPLVIPGVSGPLTDAFMASGSAYYQDFSASLNVTEAAGTNVTISIGGGNTGGAISTQMWVDFNNDGTFQTTESVGGAASIAANIVGNPVLTIPVGIPAGVYRLRVVVDYAVGNPVYPLIAPCPTTAYSYANTRDYTLIIAPAACSGAQVAGITAATATSACAPPFSFSPTLLSVGASSATGVIYNWQFSPDGGVFNNIGGATTAIYTPTITTVGVTYFRNSVSCGAITTFSSPTSVTLNPNPTAISGIFDLCTAVAQTLISTPSGGIWTSANPAVATVNSVSGAVTGAALGTTNVIYRLPTGCTALTAVTVNAQPSPITGPSTICQGSTVIFNDLTPGGTYFSSNPAVATVNAASGSVFAVAAGTTNLSYASVFGCITNFPLTVNPQPILLIVGLSGTGSYCTGAASTSSVTLNGSTVGVSYQLLLAGSSSGLPLIPGTGSPLNFGIQSAPGNYTVVATNTLTACSRTMVGSANIVVSPLPTQYTVSGGGSYCFHDYAAAPHIFLSGSQAGTLYTLKNGLTIIFGIAGSGGALDFGAQPDAGCYTIVAQGTGACQSTMLGSACVTINSLPTGFNILPSGSNSYCIGGPGIDIKLDFSNTGVSYQLFNGSTPVSTLAGTGGLLDFGMQSVSGTYTIVATNTSTGCTGPMFGASTINQSPLPNQHNVAMATGGSTASYCAGGAGVEIILDASDGGVNYQLYMGVIPVGASVGGTGSQISFGFQITPGNNYKVVATDAITNCTINMVGTVTVSVNPLPALKHVTGGGSFCVGGTGVHVGIDSTTIGIAYQLSHDSSPIGGARAGTGGHIDFGIFTTAGPYTVAATNTLTGCSRAMTGVATVAINLLPLAVNVTGTASYCAGGTGTPVGLDFSTTGITYKLFRGSTAIGTPVSGTGAAINFGLQTVAGNYTAVGTNVSTGCSNDMAGSAAVLINPLPSSHLVTGGGNFCATDSGRHVGINGSNIGTAYQLFLGITPLGSPVTGTGSTLDFGLQTIGGTYTVIAANGTGCTRYMTGGVPVNINPLPNVFMISGGGLYCAGSGGVNVGLTGSASGISYQLYNGMVASGLPVGGTGGALNFGVQTVAGTYTVGARNLLTGCQMAMSGSVFVATTPLPSVFTVAGGGHYCIGDAGREVTLSGSQPSVNYQLYRGTSMAGLPVAGTGSAISFGTLTATGGYTVMAKNTITGCTINMVGSASVAVDPLPTSYPVTGGGNYCAGGAGFHVILLGSGSGVNYQLYNGGTLTGVAIAGTGSGVDFGLQTASGSYTVVANDPATTCGRTMAGSATINIYALPDAHTVTGGGSYCLGGAGVNVGLDGSNFGTIYQLYKDSIAVGLSMPGTGANISFGLRTAAAGYTVVATTSATGCVANMTGSTTISINSLPATFSITGGGPYCETGTGSNIALAGSVIGTNYQLWQGTTLVGVPVAGTGGAIDFGVHSVVGSYTALATNTATTCVNNMTGTVTVSVLASVYPHSAITTTGLRDGLSCLGVPVSFSALPLGGGTAPTFQWFVNTVGVGTGTTFSYIPVNGDIVTVVIHSNYQCAFPITGIDTVVMNVSALQMPSATVSVSPGTAICAGAPATFTAATTFGGTTPNLRWIKNSAFAGMGTTYSYIPNNGDIIAFMLGSSFPCRIADTVFSNNTTLTVEAAVVPSVSIISNPGTSIVPGQSVTFSAIVSNGGSHPVYQWIVNNRPIAGATTNAYTTSDIANRDSVTCLVEGNCGLTGFNSVGMKVTAPGVGVTHVPGMASDVVLIPNPNKGDFSVKGTLSSSANEVVTLEVTDMIGQVVYRNKVTAHGGEINEHVILKNLANGMYLLNMRTGDEKTVLHFVVTQ